MNKNIYAIFLIGFQAIIASDDISINFIVTRNISNLREETLPQETLSKEEQIEDFLRSLHANSDNDSNDDFKAPMPVYGRDSSMDQERAFFQQLRSMKSQKYLAFLNQNNEEKTTEKLLKISFDLLGNLGLSYSSTIEQINSAKANFLQERSKIPLVVEERLLNEFEILEEISQKNALPSQVSPELFEKAFNNFFGSGR